MIASEPLTFEQGEQWSVDVVPTEKWLMSELSADWMEIPTNTLIVITPKVRSLFVSSTFTHPFLNQTPSVSRPVDESPANSHHRRILPCRSIGSEEARILRQTTMT